MKLITQFFAVLFLTIVTVSPIYSQISGTGLIAYYPLRSGDVNSSNQLENLVSNNYHLTPNVFPTFVAGRTGAQNYGNSAIELNGGSSQLNYNYASNPAPFQMLTDFAIGAWATTTVPSFTNEYQNIVVVGNNDIFIRYRKNGLSYSIQAGIRHSVNSFAVLTYNIISPTNFFEDTWGNPTWHHFDLHRGGGVLELYVDGTNVAGTFISQAISHSVTNQSFKIGYGDDPNTHLNGKISDVFYYNRPLDPSDFYRITCDKTNVSPASSVAANACNVYSGTVNAATPVGATNVQWYTTPFDGTPVHTGNSYPTGTLSSTTIYYVDATYTGGCLQKSYPRATARVNINTAASAPTNTTSTANLSICSGTSTTLSASSTAPVIRWYDDPTAGTLLGQGTTFTTPVLSNTTTYYATSFVAGCGESARTAIQVIVNPNTTPAAPTIITSVFNTCGNTSMTLIANTPGTTIRWYNAPTGGTLLYTGTNYTTPVLPNPTVFEGQDTYTYFVESSTTCGGSSVRVPVTITVNYQYSMSAVASAITVCEGESATLAITTNAAQSTTGWIQGFSQVATNTFTYITPAIFSATSYTASIQPSNGCAAYANFTVTTTTAQQPAPTNTTSGANLVVCNGNSTTLSATGSGTINWYDAPTNGTLLSTGNSFTTGNLTSNTTYYAQNGSGICASNRIPVLVTVNQPATGIDIQTACGSFAWIDGNTYNNANNSATHTIVGGAANGCDSIVTLNLTINQPTTGIDVQTACGSFAWIDGNNYNSTNNNATHTIVGGAANGCDSIVTLNLTINQIATSIITEAACDSYTWTTGNGQTYSTSTTVNYTIANGSENGCDSIVTLNLTINSVNSNISMNGNNLSALQSGAQYQWIDCNNANQPINGATSQTFTPTSNGSYAVIVNNGSCSETSSCTVVSTIGLDESNETVFMLAPNPATDYIILSNIEVGMVIEISDLMGKIIYTSLATDSITNILLSDFNNGSYFIRVSLEGKGISIQKLIVNK